MPDQGEGGFAQNVHRQRHEAPAHDSQRGPLNLFTSGVAKIVVEPPEKRRPGRHFDEAVQTEADQGDEPGDQPGDNRDESFDGVSRYEQFPTHESMVLTRGRHLSQLPAYSRHSCDVGFSDADPSRFLQCPSAQMVDDVTGKIVHG